MSEAQTLDPRLGPPPQTMEESRVFMEKFAKAVCEDVAAKFGFTPTYRWKDKDTLLICDIDGTPINEIHVDAIQ